jgi:hypothetical protein
MPLSITNARICRFYEENPNVDFESINLIFIDLFEKLALDVNSSTIQTEILSAININNNRLTDINQSLTSMKENLTNVHSDIYASMLKQFIHMKKEYIDDVKQIFQQTTHENISPLLDKNNAVLFDKTCLLLNDIIPKSQKQFYSEINESLTGFYKSINDETKSLSKSIDAQSLKDFIQNFEIKSSLMLQNVQQPIFSYISASEDRINNSINTMKEGTNFQQSIQELASTLAQIQQSNITQPASSSTNPMTNILTKLYNSAEISLHNAGNQNGITLIKRIRKNNILIQNKDAETNISMDEIDQFMQAIEDQNCNGIFLSHKSGIVSKKNFQLEIHNNNVIVFVHNAEYSPVKIELAISIIDNLSTKLRQFKGKCEDDFAIPKEVLDTINNEYQLFISQKNAIIDVFKESQRKVLAQVDELRFPSLDKFLSTKYAAPIQKPGLKCDLCKSFSGNNLKALAAHKRGCIRKRAGLAPSNLLTVNNSTSVTTTA